MLLAFDQQLDSSRIAWAGLVAISSPGSGSYRVHPSWDARRSYPQNDAAIALANRANYARHKHRSGHSQVGMIAFTSSRALPLLRNCRLLNLRFRSPTS